MFQTGRPTHQVPELLRKNMLIRLAKTCQFPAIFPSIQSASMQFLVKPHNSSGLNSRFFIIFSDEIILNPFTSSYSCAFYPLTQGKSLSYFATSCLAASARSSRWEHGWGLLQLRSVRCELSVVSCSALCQDGRRWHLALQAGLMVIQQLFKYVYLGDSLGTFMGYRWHRII